MASLKYPKYAVNVKQDTSVNSDTLSLMVYPEGHFLVGMNHGTSAYYEASDLFCDYISISYDSTTISAYSKEALFNILSNLSKGERKGERWIVELERITE